MALVVAAAAAVVVVIVAGLCAAVASCHSSFLILTHTHTNSLTLSEARTRQVSDSQCTDFFPQKGLTHTTDWQQKMFRTNYFEIFPYFSETMPRTIVGTFVFKLPAFWDNF